MKFKFLFKAGLIASLSAITAHAETFDNSGGSKTDASKTVPITRAEVLADLQIYRESGLALVELSENSGNDTVARAEARAKYTQLRYSPYYIALVQRLSQGANKDDAASTR
ncbi:hypothetical protein ACQ86G_29150 [Roseateles chitinivorans]|uniref:hypothetical protein n=1 Tax=Roseateles chitinivorans TaxID=2917965 RepID=UPI003D6781B6